MKRFNPKPRSKKPAAVPGAKNGQVAARHAAARHAAGRPEAPLRVRWSSLAPTYDASGKELKRFYSLETFSNAVERMLDTKDLLIKPSMRDAFGAAQISAIKFELVQEKADRFVFKLDCTSSAKRAMSLCLVAAKNHEEFSTSLKSQFQHLQLLHQRDGHGVIAPLRSGNVYLPDRHRRQGRGREVFVYLTRWPSGYQELAVARGPLLIVNDATRQAFSRADTDLVRRSIIETIGRTFDFKSGQAIDVAQLVIGDFVATRPGAGKPRTMLVTCKRLLRRVTPAKFVAQIAGASWPAGNANFRLAPEDPQHLLLGLSTAVGEEEAMRWLKAYAQGIESGRFHESAGLPVAELEQLLAP